MCYFILKEKVFIVVIIVSSYFSAFCQKNISLNNKPIYKTFSVKDSAGLNPDGVLVLFEDNTFVNYGIKGDIKKKNSEIWYTAGRWLGNNEMVMCRTYLQADNQEQLVNEIEAFYAPKAAGKYLCKRPFVKIDYLDYVFFINKTGVTDKKQKLHYLEVKKKV